MFLCLCLTLAPLALATLAPLIVVLSTLYAPVYPIEPAPVAPVAVETRGIRVSRYERRAYPLPECRAPHKAGIQGSVKVRYSGAPSVNVYPIEVF